MRAGKGHCALADQQGSPSITAVDDTNGHEAVFHILLCLQEEYAGGLSSTEIPEFRLPYSGVCDHLALVMGFVLPGVFGGSCV